MALPPLVVSGQVIAASHINAIRNALGTWVANVDADGYNLSDVGVLTFHSLGYIGNSVGIGAVPVAPSIKLQVQAGANQNLWIQPGQIDATALAVSAGNDAGTANVPMELRASRLILAGGAGGFRAVHNVVILAGGASVALETLTAGGTNGLLLLHEQARAASASFSVRAGYNTVTENWDAGSIFAATDVVDQICVIPDGDATYTIKNGYGSQCAIAIIFCGF